MSVFGSTGDWSTPHTHPPAALFSVVMITERKLQHTVSAGTTQPWWSVFKSDDKDEEKLNGSSSRGWRVWCTEFRCCTGRTTNTEGNIFHQVQTNFSFHLKEWTPESTGGWTLSNMKVILMRHQWHNHKYKRSTYVSPDNELHIVFPLNESPDLIYWMLKCFCLQRSTGCSCQDTKLNYLKSH